MSDLDKCHNCDQTLAKAQSSLTHGLEKDGAGEEMVSIPQYDGADDGDDDGLSAYWQRHGDAGALLSLLLDSYLKLGAGTWFLAPSAQALPYAASDGDEGSKKRQR